MSRHFQKIARLILYSIVLVLETSAAIVFGQVSEPPSYTFVTIDVPLPDGRMGFTHLSDINDKGEIAGAFTDSNKGPYGFLLSFRKKVFSREIVCRGKRDVINTAPQSINRHGEIAGFASVVVERIKIPQPPHEILVTKISGFFRDRHGKCTVIDFPGANLTEAIGINDGGQVVGDYRDAITGIFHGFLWDAGQFSTFDVSFTGARSTAPSGINNLGEIVGFYFDDNITSAFPNGHVHGFLYKDGTFTSLDFPGAVTTMAVDINDLGQIVGLSSSDSSTTRSFVLAEDTFTTLEAPFAQFIQVRGINNHGLIVGRYGQSNPGDPVNPILSRGFVAGQNVSSPAFDRITKAAETRLTEAQSLRPEPTSETADVLTMATQTGAELCDDTNSALYRLALPNAARCANRITATTDNRPFQR